MCSWHQVSSVFDELRKAFTLHPSILAIFRVGLGSLIVVDVLLRLRNLHYFYTDYGVTPRALFDLPGNWSLHMISGEPWFAALLFGLQLIFGICLVVGYHTKISKFASFLLLLSLHLRNDLVISYADTLLRIFLFWSLFLPLSRRFSFDQFMADEAISTSEEGVFSFASVMILVQPITMYLVNGVHKLGESAWTTGIAPRIVMGTDYLNWLLAETLLKFPTLLEWGSWAWLFGIFTSPLLLLPYDRLRRILIFSLMVFHLTMGLTLRLGAMPYVSMLGLCLFLPGKDGEYILNQVRSWSPNLSLRRSWFTSDYTFTDRWYVTMGKWLVFTLILLNFVFSNAASLDLIDESQRLDVALGIEYVLNYYLGIAQPSWDFYSDLKGMDGYFAFKANTTKGVRDIYNDRPWSLSRPSKDLFSQLPRTYRERFYLSPDTAGAAPEKQLRYLGRYLCDERNITGGKIEMYTVVELIRGPEDTINHTGRARRHVKFFSHTC